MLFTESQLNTGLNPFSILDQAVYLTEDETVIRPQTVPIVENSRLQAYVIDFNGIRQLAESCGLDYLNAAAAVAEIDGIDLAQACIAIDEADLIENPGLAGLGAIVVRPLSELDEEFQFCLEAIDAYLSTEDETYLDAITEESIFNEGRLTRKIKKNIARYGGGAAFKPYEFESTESIRRRLEAEEKRWAQEKEEAKPSATPSVRLDGGAANQNAILQRLKGGAAKVATAIPIPSSASKATKLIQQIKAAGGKAVAAPKKTAAEVVEKAKQAASNLTGDGGSSKGSSSSIGSKVGSAVSRLTGGSSGSSSNGSSGSAGSKIGSLVSSLTGGSKGSSSSSHGNGSSSGGSGSSKIGSLVSSLTGSGSKGSSSGGSNGNGSSPGGGLAAVSSSNSSSQSSGMGLGKKVAIGAGAAAATLAGVLAYRHYQNKPKSVIAKRIAALRQTYSKFMNQAQKAPNDGIKNKLKHVAAKILSVIDKLMAFLQRKAG